MYEYSADVSSLLFSVRTACIHAADVTSRRNISSFSLGDLSSAWPVGMTEPT